jgi:hypothetical protein
MPQKIKPTATQKRNFFIHLIVFLIASAIMWLTYDKGVEGWAYPWPAWITAAWALSLIGHWCAVYTSFEDPGHEEFIRQTKNG